MKKSIFIVDLILLGLFILIILGRIFDFSFLKFIQLAFFVFITIHIIQHWKVLFYSLKKLFKKT